MAVVEGLLCGFRGGDFGPDLFGGDAQRVLKRKLDGDGLVALAPAGGGERVGRFRDRHAAEVRAVEADLGVDGVGAGDVYAETGGAGHEQRDDNDTYYSDFFCGVPGALFLGRQVLVFSFFFHFILGFVIIFFVPRA